MIKQIRINLSSKGPCAGIWLQTWVLMPSTGVWMLIAMVRE